MPDGALILGIAFALDLLIGDPAYRLHPVRSIGYVVRLMERLLHYLHLRHLVGGGLLVMLTLAIVCGIALGLSLVARRFGHGIACAWSVYLTYSCIALRDLIDHVRPVARALRAGDLDCARAAVQRIVGRDARQLDAAATARAAIETVAENFVDSLLAPLFWYVAGVLALGNVAPVFAGPLAVVGYRVVNTLDAMVGYRNARYLTFGRAAARLDDVLNFIPARLSILVLSLSAGFCGADALSALKTALRDRNQHASPNAGHPESCLAGALHLRLGGPTVYPHGTVEKPWLGRGDRAATAEHIDIACRIVFVAGCLSALATVGAMVWVAL